MLARIRKAQESESGFTLIELLVVMIIIGILAAIAIPAFLSQKNKGYEASVKSDLRSVATEISTALVDEPASVTISQVGDAVQLAVKATSSSTAVNSNINLSPNNALLTTTPSGGTAAPNAFVVTTTAGTATAGDYCVDMKNSKGGQSWKIYKAGAQGTQKLEQGTC